MTRPVLLELVTSGEAKRLADVSEAEVRQWLLDLLMAYDRRETTDIDALALVGLSLAATGHEEAEQWSVGWLVQQPTAERLDIVSTLLLGMWKPQHRRALVSGDVVSELMEARNRLRSVPEFIEYEYLLALCAALDVGVTGTVASRVIDALRQASTRQFTNEADQKILRKRIATVLTDAAQ